MILRAAAILVLIANLIAPAAAQERVTVVTQRHAGNGGLFIAAVQGYFKAEGLELQMGAYGSARDVVEAVAAGSADLGLTEFTPTAFNLAGQGTIKVIAAQAREKSDYEGAELVASNAAYAKGLRKFEDLAGKTVAIEALGTAAHYQLAEIARVKGFDPATMSVTALYSSSEMAKAIESGKADAAILPPQEVRSLLASNQAHFIGWLSEIGEPQTGALFASVAAIKGKRATVEKFVRAYRRGVADYAAALLRHDRFAKRVLDAQSRAAAGIIARYVYPDISTGAAIVEASAPFIDPKARIDVADIERQLAWYQAHGFVEKSVDARDIVDPSFTAGN
jgi:NitT/TauT family transport system substrate-binding protein